MSTSLSTAACTSAAPERVSLAARLSDYIALTKPRIAALALVTVSAGYALASGDQWRSIPLVHALLGIALVAAGSSALNQYLERATDARMRRTASRPLPAGRLAPRDALAFGLTAGVAGTLYLVAFVNLTTGLLALATWALYALVYTPLKRTTGLATTVGAIPGALPPVLGWAAAGAALDLRALALFAILFLWQFPHFLAIAWLYREEYARAGLKMLPAGGQNPVIVGLLAVGNSLALVLLSLLPARLELAGGVYLLGALLLGLAYVLAALRFSLAESVRTARGLLWTSLVYLPLLLLILVWDHVRLLS
ncbi:MAG: heme o synthase [Planctomycetaceae bacterium]